MDVLIHCHIAGRVTHIFPSSHLKPFKSGSFLKPSSRAGASSLAQRCSFISFYRASGIRFGVANNSILTNDEISTTAFIVSPIRVSAVSFGCDVGRRIHVTGDRAPARVFRMYHSTRDQIFQCGEARMNSEEGLALMFSLQSQPSSSRPIKLNSNAAMGKLLRVLLVGISVRICLMPDTINYLKWR